VAERPRRGLAIAVAAASLLCGCQPRETPQVARDRSTETILIAQIEDLKALVAKAEAGQIHLADRIAIAITSATAKAFMDASLPQEQMLGEHVRVRIERAQPFFQGNNAALLLEASAQEVRTGAQARLELGGRMVNFRVQEGRLKADVELVHFRMLDSSLAGLGAGVLERLVQDHMDELGAKIPVLEIPVRLEHSIAIPGFEEGVVMAKGGTLPLAMSVAEVIPVNERLWIFLEVKAGPWQPLATKGKG
jgi:hypothetical protein